ncbi:MAG: pyruvate formate lyase-activating protein [Ruminococcaceae bacterium]|nr:pyruvate formate lyase-activating protein [Oscillospiraceae bacterium]
MGQIHSIETFGTVDGPGVRFVVFFQGCPMRCLYCHNPDTWIAGAGEKHTASDLIAKMLRNLSFYQTGGITATGGEPLLQLDFLIELFELAKRHRIHTCLDTSGITFHEAPLYLEKIDRLLAVTDLVMLDIKHASDKAHQQLTGCSNTPVVAFAKYLSQKKVKMRVRHVLVPGYTDSEADLVALGQLVRDLDNIEKIEVLPYHTLGRAKYENLGIPYPLGDTPQLTARDAAAALAVIEQSMK